jgi:cytochrome d ubiquinol oxidase subunit I
VQGIVGDWAGRNVAENQPVKLAAFEGLGRDADGAPFTIGGYYDEDEGEVKWGLEIPKLLSLLARHDPDARVVGLDSVPEADRPPVNVVRFAFQTMAGIGPCSVRSAPSSCCRGCSSDGCPRGAGSTGR